MSSRLHPPDDAPDADTLPLTRGLRSAPRRPEGLIRLPDCVIVSVDQTASSLRIAEMGSEAAFREQRALWQLIEHVCEPNGGSVCGWRGDGAVVRFRDAAAATDSVMDLLTRVDELPRPIGATPAVLRGGIARGPALLDDAGNVFGVTLLTAVRLSEVAASGTALVNQPVARAPLVAPLFQTRLVGDLALKGIDGRIQVWEVAGRR